MNNTKWFPILLTSVFVARVFLGADTINSNLCAFNFVNCPAKAGAELDNGGKSLKSTGLDDNKRK